MYIILYGFVSSAMILLNKTIVSYVESTEVLLLLQTFVTTHIISFILMIQNDVLQLKDSKVCLGYVVLSLCGMYTNMKALLHNKIEFVLVLRGLSPLLIFPIEYMSGRVKFLQRQSILSLCVMLCCIFIYAYHEVTSISHKGLFWGMAYLLSSCSCILLQNFIASIKNMNPLQLTFYTNHTSSFFMFVVLSSKTLIDVYHGKRNPLNMIQLHMTAFMYLAFSCILGASISFLGWKCQQLYSAVHMNILGSVSKIFVIIVTNIMDNTSQISTFILAVYFLSFLFFTPEKIEESDINVKSELVPIVKRGVDPS